MSKMIGITIVNNEIVNGMIHGAKRLFKEGTIGGERKHFIYVGITKESAVSSVSAIIGKPNIPDTIKVIGVEDYNELRGSSLADECYIYLPKDLMYVEISALKKFLSNIINTTKPMVGNKTLTIISKNEFLHNAWQEALYDSWIETNKSIQLGTAENSTIPLGTITDMQKFINEMDVRRCDFFFAKEYLAMDMKSLQSILNEVANKFNSPLLNIRFDEWLAKKYYHATFIDAA